MQKKTLTKAAPAKLKEVKRITSKVTAPKTPIVAKVLNEEQKEAMRVIFEYPITVLYGPAGTGKSYVAVRAAMKLVHDRIVERIVITRPAISTEDIGYLPGDIAEKIELPYLAPLAHFINTSSHDRELYDKMKTNGTLEFVPIGLMRGRTFDNSVIVVDESANLNPHQVKMILTRIGQNSKMIFTGDSDQCDLPRYKVPVNGMDALLRLSNHVAHIKEVLLIECVRNPIITDILTGWEKIDLVNA